MGIIKALYRLPAVFLLPGLRLAVENLAAASLAISACYAAEPIALSSPQILHSRQASPMERLAAGELCRYLAAASGRPPAIGSDDAVPAGPQTLLLLDVAGNNRLDE